MDETDNQGQPDSGGMTEEQAKNLAEAKRKLQQKQVEAAMQQWQQQQKQKQFLQEHPEVQEKIKATQEKAKFDAENFEQRYTVRQKADIARLNKAQQDIENDPNYSDEEKKQIKAKLDNSKLSITPAHLPKMSPFEKGQDVGDVWPHEKTGAILTRGQDRAHVLLRPDQTLDYLYAQGKIKMDSDQLRNQADLHASMLQLRGEHALESSTDADGNESSRPRSGDELDSISQAVSGQKSPQHMLARLQQAKRQNPNMELPKILPPPTGWRPQQQRPADPMQEFANRRKKFIQYNRNAPNLRGLISEFDRNELERDREIDKENRADRREQLHLQKETRDEARKHRERMLKLRDSFRKYEERDALDNKVTKYRSEHAIDNFMLQTTGETGREDAQQQPAPPAPMEGSPENGIHSFGEYDTLPPGAFYLAPDGKVRKKGKQ